MAPEVRVKSVDQGMEKIPGLQAAGLPEREDSFHPTVPLFAGGTLGSFPPEHGKTEHPFGMVVRGSNALLNEKEPKTIEFLFEPPGKVPRWVLALPLKGYQADEAGIQRSPFPYGWWSVRHVAEPLQFRESPTAKFGSPWVFPLGEFPGLADQMGKAALQPDPFAVYAVNVANQNAFTVSNQSREGLSVSVFA